MSVSVTKNGFNVREKLKELQKPIGLKGSELMRAETAQEARDFVSAGRKNLIINGELQIWQRGDSISAAYNIRPYTADMIRIYNVNSGSGATVTQSTDVPNNEFAYSLKRDTTGYNGYSEINLPVELNRAGSPSPFIPGETYTFSYWAKSDNTWVNICRARWSTGLSSGTSVSSRLIKGHSGSGNWEKVIHQFTMDTFPSGTNTFFSILIGRNNPHVGINYFTGFQLERGKNATEFEHRSYGEELALCQRYFQTTNTATVYNVNGIYGDTAITAWQLSDTQGAARIRFPVEMRTEPTATVIGTLSTNPTASGLIAAYGPAAWMPITSVTAAESTRSSIRLIISFNSSGSATDAFGVYFYGTYLNSTIQLNAEL